MQTAEFKIKFNIKFKRLLKLFNNKANKRYPKKALFRLYQYYNKDY